MTTAITGTPELLIKLRQDLIEKGFPIDEWDGLTNTSKPTKCIWIDTDMVVCRYSNVFFAPDVHLEITPSNYTETLNQLIQTYKK